MPVVSVVIPTYNCARLVPHAIESVLTQSFVDREILVIDDGSTDETESLLRAYGERIRYVRQGNTGVAAARNRGIQMSDARYVAFLDADDVWLPEKLGMQMAALTTTPGAGACHTAFDVVEGASSETIARRPTGRPTLEELMLVGNVIGTPSTVVVERSLLLEVGGFDRDLSQCADWDLWIRLAQRTEFAYVNRALVRYLRHDRNMSRDVRLLERDTVRMLEKTFARLSPGHPLSNTVSLALGRNYSVFCGSYMRAGSYGAALRCAARAVLADPSRLGCLAGGVGRILRRRFRGVIREG